MRLPHHLVASPLFSFQHPDELIVALGNRVTPAQIDQIRYLSELNLPPVVSNETLAAMIGINSGLIWSFLNRPERHYRLFEIPKGNGVRHITAPRVALKVVQKWLSYHIAEQYTPPAHVFGFVRSRSHLDAAKVHVGADWALSVDIENFFQTTPLQLVLEAYRHLGYDLQSSGLLAKLSCYRGMLAQGAPTSPVLSNICFRDVDRELSNVAAVFECRFTRYADDLVFSGEGQFPIELQAEIYRIFVVGPWSLAAHKESRQPIKGRIKVHGLLVQQEGVRLTKGYRNQIRAYAHVLATRGDGADRIPQLRGHVEYARHIGRSTGGPTGISPRYGEAPMPKVPTVYAPASAGAEISSNLGESLVGGSPPDKWNNPFSRAIRTFHAWRRSGKV